MSLSGSQTRLHQIGRRSSSRPDLTAVGYSLPRSDGAQFFTSGNGYQSDYNDGYTFTQTFSRNSQGGGAGGAQRSVSAVRIFKCIVSKTFLFINSEFSLVGSHIRKQVS